MLNFEEVVSEYNTPEDLIKMLNALDIITLNHSVRVCEICKYVEKDLGLEDKLLSEAGLYHDIGKYYITEKLLNKRGRLTQMERIVIDSHSYLSFKILSSFELDDTICLLALYHHRFDPIMFYDSDKQYSSSVDDTVARLAKVLKTVDIYEALTTDRPYHRGVSSETAIQTIRDTVPDCDSDTLDIIEKYKERFI